MLVHIAYAFIPNAQLRGLDPLLTRSGQPWCWLFSSLDPWRDTYILVDNVYIIDNIIHMHVHSYYINLRMFHPSLSGAVSEAQAFIFKSAMLFVSTGNVPLPDSHSDGRDSGAAKSVATAVAFLLRFLLATPLLGDASPVVFFFEAAWRHNHMYATG